MVPTWGTKPVLQRSSAAWRSVTAVSIGCFELPHRRPTGEQSRELMHQFLRISMAVYSALDKALKSRLSDEVYGSVPDSVAEMLGLPDPDDMMKE